MDSDVTYRNLQCKVYKIRWVLLFVLWLLSFTNGIIFISFSSIADIVKQELKINITQFNWLPNVFPLAIIIIGVPIIWVIDKIGLRLAMISCGWLNLSGSVLRVLGLQNKLYSCVLLGQIFGAIAQPLVLFLPARLAGSWFTVDHRAIITTISALGNPLGILVGSALPPILVKYFKYQDIAILVLSLMGALLATFCVRRSLPLLPPSKAAFNEARIEGVHDIRYQLRLCFMSLPFILLCLAFSIGVAVFTSISSLLEQIILPYGFSDTLAGYSAGLLILCGLIGSVIGGYIADETKLLIEVIQLFLILACFGLIGFTISLAFYNVQCLVPISLSWFGTFGIPIYSLSLELGAEITYPVSEHVSSGLLVVASQLTSFILMTVIPLMADTRELFNDLWSSTVLMSVLAVVCSFTFVAFFRGQYRRRMVEEEVVSIQDDNFSSIMD